MHNSHDSLLPACGNLPHDNRKPLFKAAPKQLLAAGRNVCFKSKLSVADSRVSWTYRKVPSYIAHKSLIMWISEIDCGRKDGLREKLMRAED